MSGPLLSCRGLWLGYGGRAVVRDVSLDVAPGEAVGLVGPAGSGKSPLLRMAGGLTRPESGSVLFDAAPLADLDRQRLARRVGYVPRSAAPLPTLTVADTVEFWARVVGVGSARRGERVREVLAATGIDDRRDVRVDRCDGVTLRELCLAVALLGRPRLLVLDDPVDGVLPAARHRVVDTVRALVDRGVAVLCAARSLGSVLDLCSRVAFVEDGSIIREFRRNEMAAPVG